MKLETFFEKFDQFADAPDSIGTLREVILQLAVSGRLVSQSKTDAPVDVDGLDEQAAPRKQAEGRSGASLDAVTEDEIAEEIPDSWVWVRLFRLCEPDAPIVYGILQPGPDVRPNGVPYVRPTEIKDGQIRLSEIRHTSPEIAAQYTRATIRKGDVLLTIVGTLGATAVVPVELDGGNITQSSCRLRPDPRFIDTSYLVICLRARTLLNQYRGFSLGSAVQRLNIAHVRALAIPLPPLAEQKRIVAKVDELMALCDRLEAQQQERDTQHAALARASLARFADAPTPATLQFLFHPSYAIPPADLRKSILTLAVQGKLVPQDPNDEPAEDLITTVRAAALESGYRGRTNSEDDNNPKFGAHVPDDLPPGWGLCPLEDLFRFIDYRGRTPVRRSSGVRLITAKNVKKGFVSNDPVEFIDDDVYPKWMTRGFPKKGDLLFVTEGHTMGFVGTLNFDFKYALAQRTIDLQPFCDSYGPFYLSYLLSEPFQAAVVSNTTGSAAQGIKAAKLKRIRVVVPPLAEQHRIVAKVEQLMALVDALETQLATSRATAANLLSALVAELTASS